MVARHIRVFAGVEVEVLARAREYSHLYYNHYHTYELSEGTLVGEYPYQRYDQK